MNKERLRNLLNYDPLTGTFTNALDRSHNSKAGEVVGYPDSQGYLRAIVDGKQYRLHRLAWLHYYGSWPSGQIDHINCDKKDNRISNLREATHSENKRNMSLRVDNKSGHKGVYFDANSGRWRAQVKHHGKNYHAGSHATLDGAVEAARRLREELHGTFHNHGVA